jgi:hypothetical protein
MERNDDKPANASARSDETGADEGGVSGLARSVASTFRQTASTIPAIVADGLEAGAEALRRQRPGTSGTMPGTSVALAHDSSVTDLTDTLASGMKSSADWIRDADLDKLKDGVEKQVKEHPTRSLLVALGAGYLLGRVLRR